ncbi:hypothetical protein BH11ARM2_BH11ARM2_29460 [soil metagenome]
MRGSRAGRIQAHVANLGSEDDVVYRRALRYLAHYGSRAFEPLVEACAESSELARCRAVMQLGRTKDPRGLPVLVELLQDSSEAIRYDAGVALGLLGDVRAVPVLIESLIKEPEDDLVLVGAHGAWQGLADMGEAAIPALLRALPGASAHGRAKIGFVLAGTGAASVMPVLQDLLSDPDASVRDQAGEMIEDLEFRLQQAAS